MRHSQRRDVSLYADCRTPWGKIERVKLASVSVDGCRATTSRPVLVRGDHVLIRTTASLLGAAGVVRWVDGLDAGIAFVSPLDDSVLADLVRNCTGGSTVIVPGRREAPCLQP
jgi:hypothetical protein